MPAPDTICFTCSNPTGEPPRLNHMPNGKVCPSCRDRLLDTLPPAMPQPPWETGEPKPLTALEGEEAEEGTEEESPNIWAPERPGGRDQGA